MSDHIKIALLGFFQIFMISANTWFISQYKPWGIFPTSFVVSILWCLSVKRITESTLVGKIVYSLFCACGCVAGVCVSKLICDWMS